METEKGRKKMMELKFKRIEEALEEEKQEKELEKIRWREKRREEGNILRKIK